MFLLDSLMISGLRWTLETLATAADAELNDDAAVREQLLEAEMRREMGEISDEEFRQTEAGLLARLREIRDRREGGTGPLEFAGPAAVHADAGRITVEASVTGDFHPPSPAASARHVPSAASPQASARQVPSAASPQATARQPRKRKPVPPAASRSRTPRT